jgi:hypothetical protein
MKVGEQATNKVQGPRSIQVYLLMNRHVQGCTLLHDFPDSPFNTNAFPIHFPASSFPCVTRGGEGRVAMSLYDRTTHLAQAFEFVVDLGYLKQMAIMTPAINGSPNLSDHSIA